MFDHMDTPVSKPNNMSSTQLNVHPFSNISTSSPSFKIIITGQIESASFPSTINNLYCRYIISHGKDWNVTHGVTSGLSQISQWKQVVIAPCFFESISSNTRPRIQHPSHQQYTPTMVWNFPIEISVQSTNAYGWPRISIAVYGLDFLGRDVARGYGSLLIPTMSGQYEEFVETYRPISGSLCHRFMNWLNGSLPEYYETKFTAQGEGRAVTRVLGEGCVKINLNVRIVDIHKYGFA